MQLISTQIIKLRNNWKNFYQKEEGSVVLEVVIVIAIVLAITLVFNEEIKAFASEIFSRAFDTNNLDQVFK